MDELVSTNPLHGEWTFVSMTVDGITSSETDFFGTTYKSMAHTIYTTINNKGTYLIEEDSVHTIGASYDIDTKTRVESYEDGVLIAQDSLPFKASLPPTSSSLAYTQVGSDSLYMQGASFGSMPGGSNFTGPSGGKFKFVGTQLHLTLRMQDSQTEFEQGVPTTRSVDASILTILERRR